MCVCVCVRACVSVCECVYVCVSVCVFDISAMRILLGITIASVGQEIVE